MGLTVRKALELPVLKKVKVVGGRQGLDNTIQFVNVMEVLEIGQWLKGGELLITTGYHFRNDISTRRRTIFDLAEKKVAAFGIKLGPYLEKIPEDMVECADIVGLPLLELDPEVPYIEIMMSIFEILLNDQLFRLKRSQEIHNKLLEALVKGNGLETICQILAEIANNPVLITDKTGNMLSSAVPVLSGSELKEHWQTEFLECFKDNRIQLFSQNPHRWHRVLLQQDTFMQNVIFVPITANGDLNGNLVISETFGQLDELDLIAMEDASTLIALEFLKERAVMEKECQIRGELLEDLLRGNFTSEEDINRRANYLNFNLNDNLLVFVINIDNYESIFINQGNRDDKRVFAIKSEIFQIVHFAFLDYPDGAMLLGKTDSIIGLVHLPPKDGLKIILKKQREIAKKIAVQLPRVKFFIGLGRPYSRLRDISKSYEEAVEAVRIGGFMNGPSSITFFEDLGAYRFLFELKDSMPVKHFCNEYLGKIIDYDRQNSTELLKTLLCYFQNNCSLNRTAKSLFIHKNSVTYRINKIKKITGLDLNNPDQYFCLQLCLKYGQLFLPHHFMFNSSPSSTS